MGDAKDARGELVARMTELGNQIKLADNQIADATKMLAVLQGQRDDLTARLAEWGGIAQQAKISVVL